MGILLLKVLGFAFLIPSLVLFLHVFTLALVSLVLRGRRSAPAQEASNLRFAIIVPAHNEELSITETLQSCLAIRYPKDKYDVFVVADNCIDSTVEIVRRHNVRCLERYDERHRGKGFALRWAFDRILPEGHDAFVVLDADCRIDASALGVFAHEIGAGQAALQANCVVSNPDGSPISYAVAVGNAMENRLYYEPKSKLGLMVSLRGTGMALRRDILECYPWRAFSIVEDLDYSLTLYRNGIKVKFLPDIEVRSPFPETHEQLTTQRRRWAGGNARLSIANTLRLFLEGLLRLRPLYFDMALTVVSQSKPFQLILVGLLYLVSMSGILLSRDHTFDRLFGFSTALALGYALYIACGIFALGLSKRRLALLLQSPPVLMNLAVILLRGILASNDARWRRTPRGDSS